MQDPKFLVDAMLGRLAKWLILLGYDTAYRPAPRGRPESEQADFEMAYRARAEGRILITRDTRIPDFVGLRKLVLQEQRFEDQLRRVLAELELRPQPERLFSRCTYCNLPVRRLAREEALPRVPEKVRALQTTFFTCLGCGRLYWSGTHVENTIAALQRMGLL